ncbi:MAG: Resolvase protein [Firmicutes bacterium]|nr:Resolvase protein [Bacillota bacterium]
MNIVAVYARVSTVEQAETGYSLATQLDACRKRAAMLGAKKIEEFVDDGYSGEFIDRPALTQLRKMLANNNLSAVIVYDPDRLARNLAHQLIITDEIEQAGAQLLFVSVSFEQSPEGKLFYSIRGAVSAYEKEKIKERSMRGKRGKAAQGKIIADAKPFGYTYNKEISNYEINESEAQIVQQMYTWLTEEKIGTATIARRLNEIGVPSPRLKKPWIVSAVYRLLTNPIYRGTHVAMRYRYQKVSLNKRIRTLRPESEWIDIPVPAIVDTEVWQAAQSQLKANKSLAKRNLKREQLLSGLVYCAQCGRKMTITYAGKATDPKSYYVCMSQRSNSYIYTEKERCRARRIPCELLDQTVYEHLYQLSKNPRLIKQYLSNRPHPANTKNFITAIERLQDNEVRLVKQREMVLRWYRQQMIAEDEAERQLKEISDRINDVGRNLAKIREEMEIFSPNLSQKEIITAVTKHFALGDHSYEAKRAAVHQVLKKVIAERTDTTKAKASRPEIEVELKFT